jgi:hypothetical protein
MGLTLAAGTATNLHNIVNTLIVRRLLFGNRLARIMLFNMVEASVSTDVGKTFG